MTDISIHNVLFSSYITNKHIIKYNITFNNNNSILFNNSTILPTLYSNYIYQFYQPTGFFILNNYNLSSITRTPNILETDYVTISTDTFNISLRINNTIKNSIPSSKASLVVPIMPGQNNHTLQIEGDNFKNIPVNTEIYFTDDIYFSNSEYNTEVPKTWTKIFSKNTIYKTVIPGNSLGHVRFKDVNFTITSKSSISYQDSGYGFPDETIWFY